MKSITLSGFEYKISTLDSLPRFWSIIYFESGVKCLEDFENKMPNDSEYFTHVKSSPVNYHKFLGMIQNINEKRLTDERLNHEV